jgi:hypothetical protein
MTCPSCGGSGDCKRCKGKGVIIWGLVERTCPDAMEPVNAPGATGLEKFEWRYLGPLYITMTTLSWTHLHKHRASFPTVA